MVGFNPQKMPQERPQNISEFAKAEFAKLDKNGNGKIDRNEVPTTSSIFNGAYSVREGDTIKDFVRNNENQIQRNTIQNVMEQFNKKTPPKTE